MTTAKAADYLKLEPDTVRKYIQRGLINRDVPDRGKVGRDYFITRAECDRFLRNRKSPGNPNLAKHQQSRRRRAS